MIAPPGTAGDAARVTSVVNVVEGWKLATLAFIVCLRVSAGVVTSTGGAVTSTVGAGTLAICEAAAELSVEALGSGDGNCGGDTTAAGCAGPGCSLEEPASTFLMADLFAILPGFADEPVASEETEASVRPEIGGALILYFTEPRCTASSSDAVAAAGAVTVKVTGARGTAFSLEAVTTSGVVT